jgi:peptide/nickel transport system ATP-binding protein
MSSLVVDGLSVDYQVGNEMRRVVEGVSLTVKRGEVLGLVGESGCGKSTLARAILRLLPRNGRVRQGSVVFDGRELLTMPSREFRSVQWDRISMVFQGAMNVLDPVYQVGRQITEAIRTHRKDVSRKQAWLRAEELLKGVGIDARWARAYPHELSGGMKQRVGIAMAMALTPDLVIADEPTTALDVVTQDNVLEQLTALQRERGFLLIIVSHDMGVIAETCNRIAVMYAGRIVEMGPIREIFRQPAHPYTAGLIRAIPRIGDTGRAVSIPGYPPEPGSLRGCQFEPRCPFREPICSEPPPWHQITADHGELCFFPDRRELFAEEARRPEVWEQVAERLVRRASVGT